MADCTNFGLNWFYSHEYSIICLGFFLYHIVFFPCLGDIIIWNGSAFFHIQCYFTHKTWMCAQKCIFLNKFPCLNMRMCGGGKKIKKPIYTVKPRLYWEGNEIAPLLHTVKWSKNGNCCATQLMEQVTVQFKTFFSHSEMTADWLWENDLSPEMHT